MAPSQGMMPAHYVCGMIASIVSVTERPDLVEAMWSMPSTWPAYMFEDPIAEHLAARIPPPRPG